MKKVFIKIETLMCPVCGAINIPYQNQNILVLCDGKDEGYFVCVKCGFTYYPLKPDSLEEQVKKFQESKDKQ